MPFLERPIYRYDLRVDVPATETAKLVDALAGEALTIKERLGWEDLKAQIEQEQTISVEVLSDDVWADFEGDIRTLSVYLTDVITGREVFISPAEEAPDLRGWLILGKRGDSVRIPLSLGWDEDANVLVDNGVDRENLKAMEGTMPAWVKDALSPQLRT